MAHRRGGMDRPPVGKELDAHVVNSTPQQIELKAGETQTRELVFFNSLKPGIHLVKVDSITMRSLPNVPMLISPLSSVIRSR